MGILKIRDCCNLEVKVLAGTRIISHKAKHDNMISVGGCTYAFAIPCNLNNLLFNFRMYVCQTVVSFAKIFDQALTKSFKTFLSPPRSLIILSLYTLQILRVQIVLG